MKIKTKGKCSKCEKMYGAAQAGTHLLACALKSDIPSTPITEGHPPSPVHEDPRSQKPHGHVPGVTNPDGTPWLPIY